MNCEVYKKVRIKNWILRKNNLTGCSSDITNGYATCEQKWQGVIRETEKAVLVRTVKGEFWFPKSTVVEEAMQINPSMTSPCRQLDNLVEHAEWMAEELGISFNEAVTRRCKAIEKQIAKHKS